MLGFIHRIKSPFVRFSLRASLLLVSFLLLSVGSLYAYAKIAGPPIINVPINSTYYAADDAIIAKNNQSGIKRDWVALDDVSDHLIDATIAIEDKRFYRHYGFDIKRVLAATLANVKARTKVEGASTITMQYARNVFLSHEKTWSRKIKETLYAIRLEFNYSKEEILEGYLNTIYYGHGAYGIEEAANYYFEKPAHSLTLSEASLMAGIPKGPNYYSPELAFDNAKQRQEVILEAMSHNGYISELEQNDAKAEKVHILDRHEQDKPVAPYFLDAVEEALIHETDLNPTMVEAGGLHVHTTLDTTMQQKAEKWIEDTIESNDELQSALMTLQPRTGAVKAMVGGRDYANSSFNRAMKAKRAPGSTFKPFLYYAALENGFTPSTPLLSEPTTFQYNDGTDMYSPKNYDDHYADDFITLAQAIALSDNTYAVKTHMLIGQDKLIDTAERLGITSPLTEIPSLSLGTEPVTVLEMTQAYSAFANKGKQAEVYFIEKVTDADGNLIYEKNHKQEQVLNQDTAFVTTALMAGMFDENLNDYTSVTGSSVKHILTRPMAGKSGTTATDSWMIGFTPDYVTAVWNGYDKDKELHPINDTAHAKQIWANYMEDIHEDKPANSFSHTKNVVGVTIDPSSGLLATDSCPTTRHVYYLKGTEPTDVCDNHGEQLPNHDEEPSGEQKKWWDILLNPFD